MRTRDTADSLLGLLACLLIWGGAVVGLLAVAVTVWRAMTGGR